MSGLRTRGNWKNWLAGVMLGGFVFLLPLQKAEAVANLNLSTAMQPADTTGRASLNMDQRGTWNGFSEVTNSTGDSFTLTVQNTGDTAAFDVAISVNLPARFRLPTAPAPVAVSTSAACTIPGGAINADTTASQNLPTVTIGFPNNRDNIPSGCTYSFTFGLTTQATAPYAAAGPNTITYNVAYNDGGPGLSAQTTQIVQVNPANVSITKTALTASAANGNTVNYRINVTNTGTGGAFRATVTDFPGANLTAVSFTGFAAFNNTTNAPVPVPPGTSLSATQYRFNYIPANVRIEITVQATTTVNPTSTTCPNFDNDATVAYRGTAAVTSNTATVNYNLQNTLSLTYDLTNNPTGSYCELCGIGTIRLTVANTGAIALNNITITQDMMASGLVYVSGSTRISFDNPAGAGAAAADPVPVSATAFSWTIGQLDNIYNTLPATPTTVTYIFQVRRATGLTQESLISAIRNMEARASYTLSCGGPALNATSGIIELPIHQPIPQTIKLGRNVDAGQGAGLYAADVYGHVNDDVIWRVQVQNTGLANMQDLLMDDAITGNFDINWICNTEAAASNAATVWPIVPATPPAGCISASNLVNDPRFLSRQNFTVDDPFGTPANDEPATFIDVPAAGTAFIYYVGRILNECSNPTNTANIEWGCEVNAPDGGISSPATTGGATPANTIVSTANMSTTVFSNGLNVAVALTGTNQTQPLGTKGLVTITITNNSGGTVRLWDGTAATANNGVNVDTNADDNSDIAAGITFENILPVQYVMDRTFVPTAVMAPAYGAVYLGMVDRIVHTNPVTPETLNIAPRFRLYSSTRNNNPNSTSTIYDNMIRNGDVLTIQFGIVLIDPTHYDITADLDVAPEVSPTTDPNYVAANNAFTAANNRFTLRTYQTSVNICPAPSPLPTIVGNYPANPEDLDVSISDALFILTNDPGLPLPLNVDLTNNGGHDADDYYLYVSFGATMVVQTPAPGCVATTNPPPHPTWNYPDSIPGPLNGDPDPASVYVCNRGVIAPGATERFTFNVIKSASAPAINADDLTFRADVIGEITLSNGTPLTFPTPTSIARTTPNQQLANNYTLDAIRSRVLGFNLTKASQGFCTENNSPLPALPDSQVQIGEDCVYHVESGGWFGFLTPGYTLIAVEDVVVMDDLPGLSQGYISQSLNLDPLIHNSAGMTGADIISGGVTSLDTTDIQWQFNAQTNDGITVRDQFFRADVTTRLLNEPVDTSVAPNVHSALSTNIGRTSFNAIFNSITGNLTIPVSDALAIPGYPPLAVRSVDKTVTEPNLTVVKRVCNETLYGSGTACSSFVPLANDGDTQDSYIYRVEITNEAASGGVARAPAYDVTAIDTLDARDQMYIMDFATDGLDNDGDGLIDAADPSESTYNDNILENGIVPVITASYTHSNALLQINPGATVTYYYRINPADSIAPYQTLTNTVYTTYDSLYGEYGAQNDPRIRNDNTSPDFIGDVASPDGGRARLYTSPSTNASVQMLQLQTQPKAVINVSNQSFTGAPPYATGTPLNVVVGEEVEYELHAQIPVTHLRNFTIRDELPLGVRCVEAQNVDLNAAEYSAAGFRTYPGGLVNAVTFPGTCDPTGASNVVQWSFGNQELTTLGVTKLFDFRVRFTARVENTATSQNACNIRNGGSTSTAGVPDPVPPLSACSTNPTLARLTYVDETGATITLNYASVDVVVREPVVTVTKSFAPVTSADADDILTVIVTATNSGTSPAYNLQILDDLVTVNRNLHYFDPTNQIPGGTNPPDSVTLLGGNNDRPIFNWASTNPLSYLAPNNTFSFTYQVQADPGVQPYEVLDNTIEARWTSLADNTALPSINGGAARTLTSGAVGTLGDDGADLGMRNGQLTGVAPTSNNLPNDYNASATASVTVPALTFTKNDLTPAVIPAIGEHKQFQLVINLPEGEARNVSITDNLVAGGVSYFLENNATYDVTYQFPGIESINGTNITAMAPAAVEALFSDGNAATQDVPSDNASGPVAWNIGTVNTLSENDIPTTGTTYPAPQIIITYYARINNDAATNVGSQLRNGATLNYTNGETNAAATPITPAAPAAVTVVEPALSVTKTVSNITQPGLAPDAGDVLQYVVTINNTGNATAFDINIRDTLPAALQLYGLFTPTATINTVAVAGFISTPANSPAGPLIWGRANGDETLDLPAAGTLVITYQVIVQNTAEPNLIMTNSVAVDWTSLNGANALERTGAGNAACPDAAGVVAAYNDYCTGPITSTITTSNLYNITKAYNSDSYVPVNDAQLRVGDTVQYTLTLSLQEGTTRNLSIVDTLPNGMEFVSVVSVNNQTSAPYPSAGVFTYTDIAAPVVTTGVGNNTITWTIGDITNVADNIAANNDLVIVYTARVINGELPIPQSPSTVLLNSVSMNYLDANNAAVNQLDTASITAQQPIIFLADISKTRRSGIPSGTAVVTGDTLTNPLAEVMDFELRACNSGAAPAYDLILDDILHVNMNEASIRYPGDAANAGTAPRVVLNGVLAVSGTDYTYTPPAGAGGTMRFTFNNANNPLMPGQCAVIQFDIDNNSQGINQSWDNSFRVFEYASLDSADANAAYRQVYNTIVGPVLFNMHTIAPIYPPTKTLTSPSVAPYERTVGELITYQIVVPATAMTGDLFDVVITDNMSSALTFVSATLDTTAGNAYNGALDTTGTVNNQVRLGIVQLPGGQQATINVVARVANNIDAQNTLPSFGNAVTYTFAGASGGGAISGGSASTNVANNISIVEPQLTLASKNCFNATTNALCSVAAGVPDAGDILRYTLTVNAAGGALYSDAFDVSVIDTLGLGLVYSGNPTVTNSGAYTNVIAAPVTTGDGIATQQVMTWGLANGSNIDVAEGGSITITYEVRVLDSVLANQALTNSAVVQWTSINGTDINERDGSGGLNDYFSGPLTTSVTTPNTNTITKTRLSDTYSAVDNIVRVGDVITYQLDLNLQEGTQYNLVVNDALPQGVIFQDIVSINGDTAADYSSAAPFTYATITPANITTSGDPLTGPSTLSINIGNVTNAGDNNALNNTLTIIYRARVLNNNAHAQVNNIALTNSASYTYGTATVISTTVASTATLDLRQPNLSVTKTSAQQFGDSILASGELVTYTVTITNAGTAPAYDTVLNDVIPFGMRQAGVTTTSITVNGAAVVSPPAAAPVFTFDVNTGIAIWNFDSGVADTYTIQPGQSLVILYTATADAGLGAGATLTNNAQVQVYYSFDDEAIPAGALVTDREDYGPTNIDAVTLTTPAPNPLAKVNPTNTNASIGIPFTYRITVPNVPQSTALYDVRILDNLDNLSSNVDLQFVSVARVSGSQVWTPVNTGTATDIIIEDLVNGIDIPANEQIAIDVTVVLLDTNNNIAGNLFQNYASYTFNTVNGDNTTQGIGGGAATANMTVVEPLTMLVDKTGPPTMRYGTPGTFTVDVQNTGTGPAYDLTVTDHLPNPAQGGMCDNVPTNFTARIYNAANVLQQTLVNATDFATGFTTGTTLNGMPTCTLIISTQSANAVIEAGWHLVVTYDAQLDVNNSNTSLLTNYAAATQWFSADTPAGVPVSGIRTYTQTFDAVDPGTPAIADHQDSYTTTVEAPQLQIAKTVTNANTGNPAYTAKPTETLRYTVTITNLGPLADDNITFVDEVDRLNVPPFFAAGSLTYPNLTAPTPPSGIPPVITFNPTGGANGTGLVTITGLYLSAAGTSGDSLTISFDVTLTTPIDSGTIVSNQAEVLLTGFTSLLSDDPNVNGLDNPAIFGDEDPTQTIIGSTPTFMVNKISDDITGSATSLVRGDILVYTLTVKNIGAEHSQNTLLRDQIPANTTYVANSTTLNGALVADPALGISPLQNGMLINAPENSTPGYMRATSNMNDTGNVAVITFRVTVNNDTVNGTVISNQAYVGGEGVGSGAFAEQLSDDPRTVNIIGDPTRNIVGTIPILDAQKTVQLTQTNDTNANGIVDPLEILTYTIVINNSGITNATGVVLQDNAPANTTYVADSLTMNGWPVGQPDGGVLPLIAGVDVSSSDLTPPLPASGTGTVSASQSVTVTFDVMVNSGTAVGTVISNQGLVTSNEFPNELTDADGNDINGDQPTLITVGAAQQLTISKDVFVVGGGRAQPGSTLEYFIRVTNSGTTSIDLSTASGEVLKVIDDVEQAGLLSYVGGSARLNGAIDPYITFASPRLIVNFDDEKRAISTGYNFEPGESFTVRYLAQINANAAQGATINNVAAIDWGQPGYAGNLPSPTYDAFLIRCAGTTANVDACATSSLAVGGAPGVSTLSGQAWHDSNFDLSYVAPERTLEGWEVQIYLGSGTVNAGDYLDSVFTDVNGNFTLTGLIPNSADLKRYALAFRAPGASTDTASLGDAVSIFTNGPQQITDFNLSSGSHIPAMNLPIHPNGVTYNAVTRVPVPGAVLELVNASGVAVPSSCFNDPLQQNQRTLADGYYKFELLFNDAQCPSGADYTIRVYPPAGFMDYDTNPATNEISRIIPPTLPLVDPGYDVPNCPGDALATAECEVQTSEFAPTTSEPPRTPPTNYYLKLNLLNLNTDDELYNNHLPIDPELNGALAISKTSPMVNVTRSQLVPYTITLNNALGAPVYDINVVDNFPPGFKYVAGSSRIYINDLPANDPTVSDRYFGNNNRISDEPDMLAQGAVGRSLTWPGFIVYENDIITFKMLLVVGAGVGEGEYVNLAHAENNLTGGFASGDASATVRVVPDPTFDCSDIIGKVFDDKNMNGYQDEGEAGIGGARVATTKGLEATTDEYGRYHFTCAVIPNQDRGSNFIVKLDERSLPTGYRVTTENPKTQRATRGKMLKYNFGVAIHHVIRLDMMDAVFKPGTTEIRSQWMPRIDVLITELAKEQSVLRLSYLAENENEALVNDRVQTIKGMISERWERLNCCYKLSIETEVFWRKGGPVDNEEFE